MRLGLHPLGQRNSAGEVLADDEVSQARVVRGLFVVVVDERARVKADAMFPAPGHRAAAKLDVRKSAFTPKHGAQALFPPCDIEIAVPKKSVAAGGLHALSC